MNILEIIEKKRDRKELSKDEIEFFVREYSDGNVADYQAASLIMAVFLNGMSKQETTELTLAMAYSGEVLDLSSLNKIIVDKHSTGGVGDKVSLILLPLVASCGVAVAKMSGRGLGFTGGTVDKLESIPGYNTQVSVKDFVKNVKSVGISMIAQTLNLAPADKKLYALRDSIACVESIPLIASSIMSKKIASGAQKIVLDVTVGKGAFMKDIESARKLAKEMIEIGKLANREVVCVLTNMDEPLGISVGNNLEVIEAVKFLKREEMPDDVKDVVLELGSYMLKLAGLGDDIKTNKKILLENINNGKAYEKFKELVENQGGDSSYIEETEKFEKAKFIELVYSEKDGYISEIDAEKIGRLACELGAGRVKKDDKVDFSVGIDLNKKVGDRVSSGDVLGCIYCNNINDIELAKNKMLGIVKIKDEEIKRKKDIIEIII